MTAPERKSPHMPTARTAKEDDLHHFPIPIHVTKRGSVLELDEDPDPAVSEYLLLRAPDGLLVLVPPPADDEGDAGQRPQLAPGKRWSREEKDELLGDAFRRLEGVIEPTAWTASRTPFRSLIEDCERVAADPLVGARIVDHLAKKSAVRSAAEMLFTIIAMSARARWQDAPQHVRGTAARGWFLGRWIPTFLIIDGPLGRFLNGRGTPLPGPGATPSLDAARRFLDEAIFKAVRNGFAHWCFDWEVVGRESFIVVHDRERTSPSEVRLHQRQADAFHIVAFSIIEAVYDSLLKAKSGEPSLRGRA
jgi:hypothetical protein